MSGQLWLPRHKSETPWTPFTRPCAASLADPQPMPSKDTRWEVRHCRLTETCHSYPELTVLAVPLESSSSCCLGLQWKYRIHWTFQSLLRTNDISASPFFPPSLPLSPFRSSYLPFLYFELSACTISALFLLALETASNVLGSFLSIIYFMFNLKKCPSDVMSEGVRVETLNPKFWLKCYWPRPWNGCWSSPVRWCDILVGDCVPVWSNL